MSTVRAIDTFAAFTDIGVVGVQIGQEFDSSDPIVKARPHLFKADNTDSAPKRRGRPPKVEQATAAPGEQREL
jgi:hypothetical protein